ncbi:MAG: hypothetical protein WA421_09115 [Nitrososphaeraceae archaeon]
MAHLSWFSTSYLDKSLTQQALHIRSSVSSLPPSSVIMLRRNALPYSFPCLSSLGGDANGFPQTKQL